MVAEKQKQLEATQAAENRLRFGALSTREIANEQQRAQEQLMKLSQDHRKLMTNAQRNKRRLLNEKAQVGTIHAKRLKDIAEEKDSKSKVVLIFFFELLSVFIPRLSSMSRNIQKYIVSLSAQVIILPFLVLLFLCPSRLSRMCCFFLPFFCLQGRIGLLARRARISWLNYKHTRSSGSRNFNKNMKVLSSTLMKRQHKVRDRST